MICSFVKLSKESEVTHLFLTMQPNVFVCLKFFHSVSTGMLTSTNQRLNVNFPDLPVM